MGIMVSLRSPQPDKQPGVICGWSKISESRGIVMSVFQYGFHLLLSLSMSLASGPLLAQPPHQGRLFFLGIAYDEAPAAGTTVDNFNYAPDNFTRLFQSQSRTLFSEIKVSTLKGHQATKPAVSEQLSQLQKLARADDLAIIYWGTHGGTNKKGWGANLPGNQVIYGTEIKQALSALPCPAIVLISTCGSGGFVRTRPGEVDLPTNVAAAAACGRRRSASNELDITMLEALSGFADFNADRQVTLGEAMQYLPRRYQEFFRDESGDDLVPIIHRPEGVSADVPLTKVEGNHVAAVVDGSWYGATILERMPGKAKVRFLGYDSTSRHGSYAMPDRVLEDEYIDPAGDMPPAEVESDGTWYPARILERQQGSWKIHFIGYPDSDDEVVPRKRIRFPFAGSPPKVSKIR